MTQVQSLEENGVEGEKQLHKSILWFSYCCTALHVICMYMHAHTYSTLIQVLKSINKGENKGLEIACHAVVFGKEVNALCLEFLSGPKSTFNGSPPCFYLMFIEKYFISSLKEITIPTPRGKTLNKHVSYCRLCSISLFSRCHRTFSETFSSTTKRLFLRLNLRSTPAPWWVRESGPMWEPALLCGSLPCCVGACPGLLASPAMFADAWLHGKSLALNSG